MAGFPDFIDHMFGLVAMRPESREIKVEKMILSILQYNTFFAIAPEGFVAEKVWSASGIFKYR